MAEGEPGEVQLEDAGVSGGEAGCGEGFVKLAVVNTLFETNMRDVPAMLRRCADRIEAGEYGEGVAMVSVLDAGDGIHVFGWGDLNPREAIGLLEHGKQEFLK